MKNMIPIVLSTLLLSTLVVSTSAWAQAPADPIATALSALPANLREAATVIKWKPDFTYDTLKKGTSRLVCYDRTARAFLQRVIGEIGFPLDDGRRLAEIRWEG